MSDFRKLSGSIPVASKALSQILKSNASLHSSNREPMLHAFSITRASDRFPLEIELVQHRIISGFYCHIYLLEVNYYLNLPYYNKVMPVYVTDTAGHRSGMKSRYLGGGPIGSIFPLSLMAICICGLSKFFQDTLPWGTCLGINSAEVVLISCRSSPM